MKKQSTDSLRPDRFRYTVCTLNSKTLRKSQRFYPSSPFPFASDPQFSLWQTDVFCLWIGSRERLYCPPRPVSPPCFLCDPSLKALVVPGLSDPGDHVPQQPGAHGGQF
ncbi:hypothetical protein XENORESO_001183 [Xenotaenia resolanae]|uniref:Uncharacterized protein n=1 Tax=Xenotaenia resolanae TaxID=208358 RepID=A0ABV0WRA6_9TELE